MKKHLKNLVKFIPIFFFMAFTPFLAFASGSCDTLNGLGKIICQINDIFSSILPVLVSFGVLYFIWGMVQYFIADGEEAKKTGRERIIYGIIGLAVIISIWGLVKILTDTFGLSGSAPSFTVNGGAGACTVPVSGAVGSTFQVYLSYIVCIINNSIIPLVFALAVVMFIWGAIRFFIINADEEAKREQGKQFMVWGIVALAVMLSVWGLVNILGVTFGISSSGLPHVTPPGASSP